MRTAGRVLLSGLAVLTSVGAVGSAALYAQVGGGGFNFQTLDFNRVGGAGFYGEQGVYDAGAPEEEQVDNFDPQFSDRRDYGTSFDGFDDGVGTTGFDVQEPEGVTLDGADQGAATATNVDAQGATTTDVGVQKPQGVTLDGADQGAATANVGAQSAGTVGLDGAEPQAAAPGGLDQGAAAVNVGAQGAGAGDLGVTKPQGATLDGAGVGQGAVTTNVGAQGAAATNVGQGAPDMAPFGGMGQGVAGIQMQQGFGPGEPGQGGGQGGSCDACSGIDCGDETCFVHVNTGGIECFSADDPNDEWRPCDSGGDDEPPPPPPPPPPDEPVSCDACSGIDCGDETCFVNVERGGIECFSGDDPNDEWRPCDSGGGDDEPPPPPPPSPERPPVDGDQGDERQGIEDHGVFGDQSGGLFDDIIDFGFGDDGETHGAGEGVAGDQGFLDNLLSDPLGAIGNFVSGLGDIIGGFFGGLFGDD